LDKELFGPVKITGKIGFPDLIQQVPEGGRKFLPGLGDFAIGGKGRRKIPRIRNRGPGGKEPLKSKIPGG
jgi:hypothetical protein